jgi:hypothetical protein
MGIKYELKKYKVKGAVDFGKLIKIPLSERLPALAEKDLRGTVTMVAVALTLAFETMNIKKGMTPIQIVDLAEDIVDSSEEDKIAIPDLLLFLQKLTRGEYGMLYESMDILKFMGFFNKFRDDRWAEGIRIRDEQHEYYKSLGDPQSYERENPRDATPFGEQMAHFRNKVQIRNDEIKELRSERKRTNQ